MQRRKRRQKLLSNCHHPASAEGLIILWSWRPSAWHLGSVQSWLYWSQQLCFSSVPALPFKSGYIIYCRGNCSYRGSVLPAACQQQQEALDQASTSFAAAGTEVAEVQYHSNVLWVILTEDKNYILSSKCKCPQQQDFWGTLK